MGGYVPSLLAGLPSCRTLRPYVRCTACTTPRRRGRHRGPLPGALPSPTPDTSRRCPCAMRPECAGSVPATLSHIRGQKSILSAEAYTPHTSTPTECEPHTLGTYASPCTTFPLCAYPTPEPPRPKERCNFTYQLGKQDPLTSLALPWSFCPDRFMHRQMRCVLIIGILSPKHSL